MREMTSLAGLASTDPIDMIMAALRLVVCGSLATAGALSLVVLRQSISAASAETRTGG